MSARSRDDWAHAIRTGLGCLRAVWLHGGGILHGDLAARTLTFKFPPGGPGRTPSGQGAGSISAGTEAAGLCGLAEADLPSALAALGPAVRPVGIPAHEYDPLGALRRRYPDHPLVEQLASACRLIANAPWPERIEAFEQADKLVRDRGIEARRGAGEHYADRYVVHEEQVHPASGHTTFGRPAMAGIMHAVTRACQLAMLDAQLAREDARQAVRQVLAGQSMPLARLLAMPVPAVTTRRDALHEKLRALVRARTDVDGTVARLTHDDIESLVTAFDTDIDATGSTAVAAPDLMAVGPDLSCATWLLGELHDDGSYIAGGVTRLHADGVALRRFFDAHVAELFGADRMAAVVGRRRGKFLLPELPGLSIEMGGVSIKPRDRVVSLADIVVPPQATGVLVNGAVRLLYPGEIPSLVHRALAAPALTAPRIDCGVYTPRIYIDDVIIQRATWRIPVSGRCRGFAAWREAARLRRDYALPRRVFVRHPDEPKPLFVDFADPAAVTDVMRLADATVIVTEMLPDYPDLWWSASDGTPSCSELRLACFVQVLDVLPGGNLCAEGRSDAKN